LPSDDSAETASGFRSERNDIPNPNNVTSSKPSSAGYRDRVTRGSSKSNLSAGVIGLTTALLLVRNGYQVTIVARAKPGDTDVNYASPWAGAFYRPIPDIDSIDRYETDLGNTSYNTFKKIASTDPSSGVKMIDAFEYLERPPEAYTKLKGRYPDNECFRVLKDSELPSGVKFGTTYRTWSINPLVYLSWLERQLVREGVQFVRYNLMCIAEVFSLLNHINARILINCSGAGFSDPQVYPIRGTIILFTAFTVHSDSHRTVSSCVESLR
jgi:D-amino-acid oxidase